MCTICGLRFLHAYHCHQTHPDHCHDCYARNLYGGFDAREHPAPRALPALTPRAQAAVAAYVRHVQSVCGTGPLVDIVTEDPAP